MRRRTATSKFVLVIMLSAVSLLVSRDNVPPSTESLLALRVSSAISQRMSVIERRWRIDMGDPNNVSLEFGDFHGKPDRLGGYIPSQRTIVLNSLYLEDHEGLQAFLSGKLPFETERPKNSIREVIDHELGHAYADYVSRSLGRGYWPNNLAWNSMGPREKVALRIISEGIGMYFGLFSIRDREMIALSERWPTDLSWITNAPNMDFPVSEEHIGSLYVQGYWLVKPILDKDLWRGVEYLVSHPFVIRGQDFGASAEAYRAEALAALDTPPSS